MFSDLTLVSALLMGLLGSTHCLGMCGGIVGALTLGVHRDAATSPWRLLPYLLAYNAGRITSYAVAGALLGLLGGQLLRIAPASTARVIAGGFMIAFGFYLSGWWRGLGLLERWGATLWTRIEPIGRRWLPVSNPKNAFLLGLLWGWLPCGMVYAALAWSLAAGSAAKGATLMLAFGIGTLPMLLAMGSAARWLNEATRRPWLRQVAGLLLISFGIYYAFFLSPAHVHAH